MYFDSEIDCIDCSGVDTRILTKKIRENGTLLGKVSHPSVYKH